MYFNIIVGMHEHVDEDLNSNSHKIGYEFITKMKASYAFRPQSVSETCKH